MPPDQNSNDNILIDGEGVRRTLYLLEQLADDLSQRTRRLQLILAAADQGDPRGYLNSGLSDGYAATDIGRTAEAELRDLIRNAKATIMAFEQHDRDVNITAASVDLPILSVVPAALGLSSDDFSLSAITERTTEAAQAIDADDLVEISSERIASFDPQEEIITGKLSTTVDIGRAPILSSGLDSITDPVILPAEARELPPVELTYVSDTAFAEPVAFTSQAIEPPVPAVTPILSYVPSPTVQITEENKGWWDSIWSSFEGAFKNVSDWLGGVVAGITEWFSETFKSTKELFGNYIQWLKEGNPWAWASTILVALVIVVVIVLLILASVFEVAIAAAVLAATLDFLFIIGEIVFAVFALLSVASIIYYLYRMIKDPGLSARERGKLFGKASMESVFLFLSVGELARLGQLGKLPSLLDKVGDAGKLIRLLRQVRNAETLIILLDKVGDADKLIQLLDKAGDVEKLLKLLTKVNDVQKVFQLLDKVGGVEKAILLIDKVGDADKLTQLLDKVGDSEKLLTLLDKVGDSKKLLTLLDKVGDADKLIQILSKAGDAEKLLKLITEVGDVQKVVRLIDKIGDAKTVILFIDNIGGADNAIRFIDKIDDIDKTLSVSDFAALFKGNRVGNMNQPLNLYGYNAADMEHFYKRHTYEYFDFSDIKTDNSFWPEDTDLTKLLGEALSKLPAPQIQAGKAEQITLSNGIKVQLGTRYRNGGLEIGQFFPISGPGVITMSEDEMRVINGLK